MGLIYRPHLVSQLVPSILLLKLKDYFQHYRIYAQLLSLQFCLHFIPEHHITTILNEKSS